MRERPNWAIFQALCKLIGEQDDGALKNILDDNLLPQIIEQAISQDVLPALAARCFAQPQLASAIKNREKQYLRAALLENTQRNMQIVAQTIKLTRSLNNVNIIPLFLKGTAQLFTSNKEQPGFRKQVDIDLIVEQGALPEACEALMAEGYGFYQEQRTPDGQPSLLYDIQAALKISSGHHHLPPLVKPGQVATVELHRHFLPKRFQKPVPIEPLFESARKHESHGVTFLVPSTEYQILHIVLGRLVHDGYMTRREFPIREALDYIDLTATAASDFDCDLLERHCAKQLGIFSQLVSEMMGYIPESSLSKGSNIKYRMRLLQKRCDSHLVANILNAYARAEHLSYSMLYSPAKLPAYLHRIFQRNNLSV
jgi:hypothetical protein